MAARIPLLLKTASVAVLATAVSNTMQVRAMRDRAKALAHLAHGPEFRAGGPHSAGPVVQVAVLGDSAARGFAIPRQEETFSARLVDGLSSLVPSGAIALVCHAMDGTRTVDVLRDQLPLLHGGEDLVVIGVGVNDGLKMTRGRALADATAALVTAVRARCPDAVIVHVDAPDLTAAPGFPFPFSHVIGARMRRVATVQASVLNGRDDVITIRLGAADSGHIGVDGFHPGPVGQQAMADAVCAALAKNDWKPRRRKNKELGGR